MALVGKDLSFYVYPEGKKMSVSGTRSFDGLNLTRFRVFVKFHFLWCLGCPQQISGLLDR